MKSEDDEEFDAPEGDIPLEQSEEVRQLVPSFKSIDVNKYFELIKYQPHGRQWLYHNSKARFKIPVAGRRFGKSMMVGKDVQPTLLIPNKRVWVVGPTYDLGEKEFRVIWDDMIVKLAFGREPRVKKAYNKKQGNMFIEFPWNTRVEVRSADKGDNLVGEKLDRAVMSEAAKHSKETWDRYIRPALADNRGNADFGTTPEGMNWLHEIWQYGQNKSTDFEAYESWKYPSWENSYVYPGGRTDPEILLLERTMPREWFLQEIAADFTSFMGRIYSEFEEVTHVKACPFNPNWPNYMCFDWGFRNPLAAIEFQVDPMDRIYVWREHYMAGITLNSHIEILKHRINPEGYRLDLAFGDCEDPGAVETINAQFAQCVAMPEAKLGKDAYGKAAWRVGVELVKSFLQMQQVGVADEYGTPIEEPWLFVDNSCVNTIREFNNYRDAGAIAGKTERNMREEAQKYDDHALDAIRYGLMHIFKLGVNMRLASIIDAREMVDLPDHGFFTSGMSFS